MLSACFSKADKRPTQELASKRQALSSATDRGVSIWRIENRAMKTISPVELQMLIDKTDVELIDVRPRKDFERVHAWPARSIPLSQFEPHSVLAHRQLDRHAPIYLMCRDTTLASLAACGLAGAGLDEPIVVEGGLEAWQGQCLPVVRKKFWQIPKIAALKTVLHAVIAAPLTLASPISISRGSCSFRGLGGRVAVGP
jgi:rhodanese-related sulfurtransferase